MNLKAGFLKSALLILVYETGTRRNGKFIPILAI